MDAWTWRCPSDGDAADFTTPNRREATADARAHDAARHQGAATALVQRAPPRPQAPARCARCRRPGPDAQCPSCERRLHARCMPPNRTACTFCLRPRRSR